jgi:hypothetical protein
MRKIIAISLLFICLLIPAAAQQDKPLQAKPSATPTATPATLPALKLQAEHAQQWNVLTLNIQRLQGELRAANAERQAFTLQVFLRLGGNEKDYDPALNQDEKGNLIFLPKVAEAPKKQ